jgi:hypothetical protein
MIDRRSGTSLSTADMVAGMEHRNGDEATETQPGAAGDGAFPTDRPIASSTVTASAPAAQATALLTEDKAASFRARWDTIQASFVDEPRESVEQADALVAEAIKHLAEVFAEERAGLVEQWSRGAEVSTDTLRLGLQRYRSFFQRLLAA